MQINKIIQHNVKEGLPLPDKSVNMCVTSPPYWGLRDYGAEGQLGLEKTPEEFIANMVQVFMEVHRVLKDDGTLWCNIGDTYGAYYGDKYGKAHALSGKRENIGDAPPSKNSPDFKTCGFKPKDLVGIPWMLAFALRSAGWYLRQDIIWSKPNPMPESVTDRCTKSHEYIFLLSKSQKYYYDQDAILQAASLGTHARLSQELQNQIGSERANGGQKTNGNMKAVGRKMAQSGNGMVKNNESFSSAMAIMPEKANKRSVWTVTTKPFSEAHFATFPEDLIVDCIKAGCPEGGIVVDPFMGAGTTAVVSRKLNRNFVGFELNPEYIKIANKRLYTEIGMFL